MQHRADQELATLIPWLAEALGGALALCLAPLDQGRVVASPLVAVTPALLAFARDLTELSPGTVQTAADTPLLCGTPLVDADGHLRGVLCVRFMDSPRFSAVRDAARLVASLLERHQAHAQMQAMLEGLHEGVLLVESRLQVKRFNRRAAELLGQPGRGMTQADFLTFGQQAHDAEGQPIPLDQLPMWTALHTGQPQLQVLLGAPLPSGTPRWLRVNARPIWPRGVVASLTDVTAGVRVRQAMQQAPEHDPLTGLPNRVLFETRLQGALNDLRAGGEPCAVGVLDLDGFKAVNDAFGHAAGDALLRQVTQRLTQAVRPRDLVARLAGDEFTVLWWNVSARAQAAELGARLVEACAAGQEPVRGLPFGANG